jgi:ribosomal protein S18 acetylase RimI-like enzyme
MLDDINRRIQAYLRAHALRAGDHERCGVFVASFDPEDDNPYRNYAVPDDEARPSDTDIDALIAAFVRRGRKPRLEYIAKASPAVEAALTARGFAVEKRFPILICTPGLVQEVGPPAGILLSLATSAEAVSAAAQALAEAFGQAESHPDPLVRMVEQGGVLVVAHDRASKSVAGAGMATAQHAGTSEVAGIGVRRAFRRRGIAAALTARITRAAFARGVTLAWLTPGDDAPERVYVRAGFARASEQLHISLS